MPTRTRLSSRATCSCSTRTASSSGATGTWTQVSPPSPAPRATSTASPPRRSARSSWTGCCPTRSTRTTSACSCSASCPPALLPARRRPGQEQRPLDLRPPLHEPQPLVQRERTGDVLAVDLQGSGAEPPLRGRPQHRGDGGLRQAASPRRRQDADLAEVDRLVPVGRGVGLEDVGQGVGDDGAVGDREGRQLRPEPPLTGEEGPPGGLVPLRGSVVLGEGRVVRARDLVVAVPTELDQLDPLHHRDG